MTYTLYAQQIRWMVLEITMVPLAWSILTGVTARKESLLRGLNKILLLTGVTIILDLTLLNRTASVRSDVLSLPFQLIHSALFVRRETIRSLLLNILLFTPFGAALPHLLPPSKSIWKRVMLTGVAAMLFSIAIETCQFVFSLGNAEADDVICNTLGALIGALSLPLSVYLSKRKRPYSE